MGVRVGRGVTVGVSASETRVDNAKTVDVSVGLDAAILSGVLVGILVATRVGVIVVLATDVAVWTNALGLGVDVGATTGTAVLTSEAGGVVNATMRPALRIGRPNVLNSAP